MVRRPLLLLAPTALLVAGAALWVGWQYGPAAQHREVATLAPVPVPAPPPAPAPVAPTPVAPTAPTPTPAPVAPSFDIVRVAPDGSAVIAGRAAPGAQVTVHDNATVIGTAQADPNGQFVLVPSTPLAPGGRELMLTERLPDGREANGGAPVILVVPDAPVATARQPTATPAPAMAVLVPQGAPPRVLQGPLGDAATQPGKLGLGTVDYDEQGNIRFSGPAEAGATVQLYVDNALLGHALTGKDGQWTLATGTIHPGDTHPGDTHSGDSGVTPGEHRLRVDELGANGRVVARIELPFERVLLPASAVAGDRIVVQPKQSLWRIARRVYGQGIRYTVIYAANRGQIRNPDLIYPGQVFALPSAAAASGPAASTPAPSASKSR